jgi:hypothetical protein
MTTTLCERPYIPKYVLTSQPSIFSNIVPVQKTFNFVCNYEVMSYFSDD